MIAGCQGFPRQGWQLVSCLLPYFAVLNYTGETEALLEIALGAARAAHDQVGEMVIVMGLAAVKRARGFGVESRELIGRAIALSQQHADSDSMIWQLIDLGVSYMDDGLLDEARSSYLKAEQVAIGSGDKVAQSDVANNLAVVSWAAENLEEALQYFQRAYELDREGGLSHASPYTVVNLAYVHCLLGDWNRAQDYYAEALAMSRATGSKPAEAFSLVGRCLVDRALRRPDEALEHGRAGLEVARELNLNDLESQALCAIGDVHLSTGDLAAATEVFKFALNKAHILSNEQYAARATEGLAHVHSVAGDTAKAAELWASATATWPNGIADRAGASRHLTSPQFGAAQCWRCALA